MVCVAMTPAERKRAQRARERAGLEEGQPVLRAVEDMLTPALTETIAELGLGPEDAAVVAVALRYGKCIDRAQDAGWAMRWLGPLLLDALEQLGATPAARARLPKDTGPRKPNFLDELRAARRTYPPGA